jgi:hypothetical protein
MVTAASAFLTLVLLFITVVTVVPALSTLNNQVHFLQTSLLHSQQQNAQLQDRVLFLQSYVVALHENITGKANGEER